MRSCRSGQQKWKSTVDGGYVLTIRHVVVFFYMTCVFCCFCFAVAVPASGELQTTSEGPEFGAGPEERPRISEVLNSGRDQRTLTAYRLMGFVHYIKFQHCFYRCPINETILHLLRVLQGRQGFCTLANLFRQAENCYRFSDSPLFFQRAFEAALPA